MHEVSIAMGMVDELMKIAEKNNAKKVTNVRLKLAADGGRLADDIFGNLPQLQWEHLTKLFLRT